MSPAEAILDYLEQYWGKEVLINKYTKIGLENIENYLINVYGGLTECLELFYNSKQGDIEYTLNFALPTGSTSTQFRLSNNPEPIAASIFNQLQTLINSLGHISLQLASIHIKLLSSQSIPNSIKFKLLNEFDNTFRDKMYLSLNPGHEIINSYFISRYRVFTDVYADIESVSVNLSTLPRAAEHNINSDKNKLEEYILQFANRALQDILEMYTINEKFEDCIKYLTTELYNSISPLSDELLILMIRFNGYYTVITPQDIYNLYIDNKHKLTKHDYFNIII